LGIAVRCQFSFECVVHYRCICILLLSKTTSLARKSYIIRGGIHNIPKWCRYLYSSRGSAKHRYMVGLLRLVSRCAKLHVAGWMRAVYTRVYVESCTWPVAIFTIDQRKEQLRYPAVSGEIQNGCHHPPTVLP
jgi:hypothetical protein